MAPGIPETTDVEKANQKFEIELRYWMRVEIALSRIRQAVPNRIFVGFRNTSRPWREQRTVRAALLPRYPATHGLPILAVASDKAFEFLGAYNSIVSDFLLRGHVPGANAWESTAVTKLLAAEEIF